ncbi:MAG TPA: MFS transporter [Streptosporangiaceae bacterium]|jgi:MFS family permease
MTTTTHPPRASREARRAGIASFIGTTIEWYDFYIYSTASALVLGKLFFPSTGAGTGMLASFATLWVGFLARPIGGAVFGHIGDRIGRKRALIITLLMMGAATTLVGVLPAYGSIGVAAPVLLVVLRVVQGVAVGGEWGGAVLIGYEHAPRGRGISFGAFAQQGSPAGSILATAVFALVSLLPDTAFDAWGWRVPFLFSAVLIVVGLVIRLRVTESPRFAEAKERQDVARVPLGEVLRAAPERLVLGVLASSIGIAATYFITTFILAWSTTDLKMDRSTMLNVLLVYSVAQFVTQPFGVKLAERYGVSRTVATLLTVNLVTVPLMYVLVGTAHPVTAAVGIAVVGVTGGMNYALLAGVLVQAFPVRVRYTAISMSYQLCSALIGGTAPLVGEWLFALGGDSIVPVAAYHMLLVAVSLVCSLVVISLGARVRAEEAA